MAPGMRAREYVIARQEAWAKRRGIHLVSSEPDRGRECYTPTLAENLFEPLDTEAKGEITEGDGSELESRDGRVPKMHALHSSSALGVNLFHYWKHRGEVGPVAQALRAPTGAEFEMFFERKFPIDSSLSRPPNLDFAIEYRRGGTRVVAVECKFTEPYSRRRGKSALREAYLGIDNAWDDLPSLRGLAERLASGKDCPEHLDASQLVKHVLGLLKAHPPPAKPRLVYLWYDVPGPEGALHREEIKRFIETARADGVMVQAPSVQEFIVALVRKQRDRHPEYVDYVAERYL